METFGNLVFNGHPRHCGTVVVVLAPRRHKQGVDRRGTESEVRGKLRNEFFVEKQNVENLVDRPFQKGFELEIGVIMAHEGKSIIVKSPEKGFS